LIENQKEKVSIIDAQYNTPVLIFKKKGMTMREFEKFDNLFLKTKRRYNEFLEKAEDEGYFYLSEMIVDLYYKKKQTGVRSEERRVGKECPM